MSIPTLSTATAERLQHAHLIAKNTLWSVIKASGMDIRSYLQGQITQDIEKLSPQQAIHSSLLSPQGKAISELYILTGHDDELIILTPSAHAVATVARLRQFALAHTLRIGIVDQLAVYSIHGAAAADMLHHQFDLRAKQQNRLSCINKQDKDIFALRMQHNPSVYWLICSPQHMIAHFSDHQSPDQQQINDAELEALRILQGQPVFGIEWDASLHPLNANLIEFDGVDFNKGCYVGQEVTSRMHWRGGIKKKLYRVKLENAPGELPCPILSTANIGTLKSAAIDEQNNCFGIALLPIEVAESDTRLSLENNTTITILEPCHA